MMKIFGVITLIMCTSVFASESQKMNDPSLLQANQIFLKLDTKEVKELINNAKKSDLNVYDIREQTTIKPSNNKVHTESKDVDFIPNGVSLLSYPETYRYITYGYIKRFYNNTISYNYAITTIDCTQKVQNTTRFVFDEQGEFLIAQSFTGLLTEADNERCNSNPNKKEN